MIVRGGNIDMSHPFIAENSKKQIVVFLVPAIVILVIAVFILFHNMGRFELFNFEIEGSIVVFIILISTSIAFIAVALHFYFQPRIAIAATDDEITFYKRNVTLGYRFEEIVKVLINTAWGSFDTYIYISVRQRKGFHFLVINSNKKKTEYIRFLESKGIKVIQYMYT